MFVIAILDSPKTGDNDNAAHEYTPERKATQRPVVSYNYTEIIRFYYSRTTAPFVLM